MEQKEETFLKHCLDGLKKEQKKISSKYLYDKRGSELFEEICSLDEYYVTRSEISILKENQNEIAKIIQGKEGEQAGVAHGKASGEETEKEKICIIEPGAGIGLKVKYLLEKIPNSLAYVPIEISKSILDVLKENIEQGFPHIKTHPILGDFNIPTILEDLLEEYFDYKKILFFPGSTIGNLELNDALKFLKEALTPPKNSPKNFPNSPNKRNTENTGISGILLGVDIIKKDINIINRAYNDKKGITAQFNLNLLARMNRELLANFDLNKFEHLSFFNSAQGRIEMHIKSLEDQEVVLGEYREKIFFKKGETIHTENSYKYNLKKFAQKLEGSGLKLKRIWYDDEKLFSFCYITRN